MPGATVQMSSVQRARAHARARTVHKGKAGANERFTVGGGGGFRCGDVKGDIFRGVWLVNTSVSVLKEETASGQRSLEIVACAV